MITSGKIQTRLDWDGKRTQVDKVKLPFQLVETINEPRSKTIDTFIPRADKWYNILIWGDNKLVMNSLLPDFAGKIDLIYIDPPFGTGADFSFDVKLEGEDLAKEPSGIEIKAYRDTWSHGLSSYMQMMYDRLILMRELMSERSTIYVHLNWRVGHYVKTIMDEIFGEDNFQNEIIWYRGPIEIAQKNLTKVHDTILRYTKTEDYIWDPPRTPYSESLLKTLKKDEKGYYYTRGSKHRKMADWEKKIGAGLKSYIDPSKGKLADDIWRDVGSYNLGREKTGFPTQKPEALLDRIVKASSEADSVVADFFCGSGTTLAVAEKLRRRWIGCDLSKFPIHITRKRLLDIPGCRPFQVLNLGMYQKQKLIENGNGGRRYIDFLLQLYNATPLQGFAYIHGKKGDRLVHIGPIDSFVTLKEIREAIREAVNVSARGIDILGWDFEMGLHDLLGDLSKEYGLDIRLRQIPLEVLEIKAGQSIGRLEELRFFDLNYLDLRLETKGKNVTVILSKFVIANPEYIPEEVRSTIKNFTAYIDYWAVDFDYKGDVFHNMRQEYRTKKNPELKTEITHQYDIPGHYTMLVKVVDILGNDTNKLLTVRV